MTISLLTDEILNERIIFKSSRSIEFVEVKKIIRAESSRAYCKLYFIDNHSIILSYPLKTLEKKLSAYPVFFRSHKSHLINVSYVKSYHSDDGIKLTDGSCIPLVQSLKTTFLEKMEELFGRSI
jgi:two-component system LytT family response regulator